MTGRHTAYIYTYSQSISSMAWMISGITPSSAANHAFKWRALLSVCSHAFGIAPPAGHGAGVYADSPEKAVILNLLFLDPNWLEGTGSTKHVHIQ